MKKNDFLNIEYEERPWGRFYVIHDQPNYKLKRIEVNPASRLSYQYHHKRSEAWTIIDGIARVTIDDITNDFQKGDTILIPRLSKHRVENKSNKLLIFIEVQTGEYFGEDDIVRIKDDYKRI
jgi:mannose-6-phosphate isomerase